MIRRLIALIACLRSSDTRENAKLDAILLGQEHLMSAIDDLKTAVDAAVTEMTAAAEFIKNHPATNNDPELADFATRLQAAADALHGVDQA